MNRAGHRVTRALRCAGAGGFKLSKLKIRVTFRVAGLPWYSGVSSHFRERLDQPRHILILLHSVAQAPSVSIHKGHCISPHCSVPIGCSPITFFPASASTSLGTPIIRHWSCIHTFSLSASGLPLSTHSLSDESAKARNAQSCRQASTAAHIIAGYPFGKPVVVFHKMVDESL